MAEITPHLRTQLAKGPDGAPVLVLHVLEDGALLVQVVLGEAAMHRLQEATSNAITAALKHRLGREKRGKGWPTRAR